MWVSFFIVSLIWIWPQCGFSEWYKRDEPIMGTRVFVELWHDDPAKAALLMQGVMDEMERINQLMSPYKTSSELARVNRDAATAPVQVSQELFDLVQKASTTVTSAEVRSISPLPRSAISLIIVIAGGRASRSRQQQRHSSVTAV